MSVGHIIKKAVAPLFAPLYKGKGHILMLHRIVPGGNRKRIHNTVNEITPEKLDGLITFYRQQHIHIISLDDLPEYLKGNLGYFVIFTFDDGFKDNYTEALPVFQKHNAPLTLYVTTGFPDGKIAIWWYLLENILLENNQIEFNWGSETQLFDCSDMPEKERIFNVIRRIIIDTPFEKQNKYLEGAFSAYTKDPFQITRKMALEWDEIEEMAKSPLVTIGAHTVNHPALNQLVENEIKTECLTSRKLLENKINKPVRHFSYPFGSTQEIGKRECSIIKDLGFETATTTRTGSIFKKHISHLHSLPRIPVKPDISPDYLKGIISGRQNFIRGAKHRVVTL